MCACEVRLLIFLPCACQPNIRKRFFGPASTCMIFKTGHALPLGQA